MLRIPTKFGGDLFWGGNESRGIAGPSRGLNRRDRVTGHFASGFDHFADREAVSTSNVIDQLIALFQSTQRQQMFRDQIGNMDVIANAGSIWGGIVCAENGRGLGLPKRDLQHTRDQM